MQFRCLRRLLIEVPPMIKTFVQKQDIHSKKIMNRVVYIKITDHTKGLSLLLYEIWITDLPPLFPYLQRNYPMSRFPYTKHIFLNPLQHDRWHFNKVLRYFKSPIYTDNYQGINPMTQPQSSSCNSAFKSNCSNCNSPSFDPTCIMKLSFLPQEQNSSQNIAWYCAYNNRQVS